MRGYFGIGTFHAKREENVGTLLRSAQAFGAAFVFTIGRRYQRQSSDTVDASSHVPLYHFGDLADLTAHLPNGCPLVGIELTPEAIELPRYVHPERACYLLGAEDHGLNAEAILRCHQVVVIPGAARCLNVASAGTVVIYDRVTKAALRASRAA